MHFIANKRRLDLSQPVVMGVLNITPDSFSDGGTFYTSDKTTDKLDHGKLDYGLIRARAEQMLAQGAQILDIGAESSRPGADPVSEQAELDRVMPVLARLRDLDTMLSVDTYKPAVAAQAIAAGCDVVNDITGAQDPRMLEVIAAGDAGLCMMHMQGVPATMQQQPRYDDVIGTVASYLDERVSQAEAAGIGRDRLLVDPGFGFGKSLQHNLCLLNGLSRIRPAGVPILVGLSRKSMLQTLTGRATADRLAGSVALATVACLQGAQIVRAHDVGATVDALKVVAAVQAADQRSDRADTDITMDAAARNTMPTQEKG